MQGAEERRLRRMSNTPQGGAIECNAADDAFMVDQGPLTNLSISHIVRGNRSFSILREGEGADDLSTPYTPNVYLDGMLLIRSPVSFPCRHGWPHVGKKGV
jgi:hypothetical protein